MTCDRCQLSPALRPIDGATIRDRKSDPPRPFMACAECLAEIEQPSARRLARTGPGQMVMWKVA